MSAQPKEPMAYQKIEGRESLLALDMNECLFPPDQARREALSLIDQDRANSYPEYEGLIKAASRRFGLDADWLRPSSGADEGISVSLAAFAANGRRLVLPDPVFSMYEVRAAAMEAEVLRVALRGDFSLPTEEFIEAARGASLAVLVNPGNPAGRALKAEDVERVCAAVYPCLVNIDEAYVDFVPGASAMDRLRRIPNAIILRSLSKSYGLAGCRVGFIAASPQILKRLDPFLLPYGVSRPALKAAIALLGNDRLPKAIVEPCVRNRAALAKALRAFFKEVAESDANFVLAYSGAKALEIKQALAQRGVLVKAWDQGAMAGYVRITVPDDRGLETLVREMEQIAVRLGLPGPESRG